jgi:hypothetical protein
MMTSQRAAFSGRTLVIDEQYIKQVFKVLTNDPTDPGNLTFLVEAHAKVSNLTAKAVGLADEAESQRKYADAETINRLKGEDPKITATLLESKAYVENYYLRQEENKRRTDARKLQNLLDSIEQGINAIKFLGRETGVRIGP